MQQRKYDEAIIWLEQAYDARYSLPDNGKRTIMLIHELRRRTSKSLQRSSELAANVQGHHLHVHADGETSLEVARKAVV